MTDATAGKISQDAAKSRREDAEATGPMLAADGRPLKVSLNRALRRQKLRALALIAPLLLFILITFVAPIFDMLFRSVENQIVSETLPRTVIALEDWDAEDIPGEDTFAMLAYDFMEAAERRNHTRLGSRLNYETTGLSSAFRRSGRGIDDVGEEYADQFIDLNEAWEDPATWVSLMAASDWIDVQAAWAASGDDDAPEPTFRLASGISQMLPETADAYRSFARTIQQEDEDSPLEEEPWNTVYLALYRDLAAGADISSYTGPQAGLLAEAAGAVDAFETVSLHAVFEDMDDAWVEMPAV